MSEKIAGCVALLVDQSIKGDQPTSQSKVSNPVANQKVVNLANPTVNLNFVAEIVSRNNQNLQKKAMAQAPKNAFLYSSNTGKVV